MRQAEDLLSCDPLPVSTYKEIYLAIESHLVSSVGQRLDDTFLEGVNDILISSGFYTDNWEEDDKMFIFGLSLFLEKDIMTLVVNGLSFPYQVSLGKDKEIWWSKFTGKMQILLRG